MKYEVGKSALGYKIIKKLNGGGMSDVYIGYDGNSTSNPYVVIKVISKKQIMQENRSEKATNDQWKKALDEFSLTWAIFEKPNDNIAKPIKWHMSDDGEQVSIVSEFIDGPSLSRQIAKQKALPIDRAMFYFSQIANGVKHLHQLNEKKTIIHRDLKAENIMLSKDLRKVKIIDYGIATIFYDNIFESSEGTVYCTANYTTPDILQLSSNILLEASLGDRKANARLREIITPQFDFHALGVILYEMIVGSFPFIDVEGEKDKQKIDKWLKFDIPIISNMINGIPTSIDNIIFRLTASRDEDRKYRYKNINELIKDIETWNSEERISEPLIKPADKRKFQLPTTFSVKEDYKEKFYETWWFFGCINILMICLVVSILVLTKI
ncbi:MAG: serine/threonine-protein kinase [Mycoplasma sp.]